MNISRYLSVRFGLNYLDVENAIEEFYESDREDREDHDNTTVRTIVSLTIILTIILTIVLTIVLPKITKI